MIRLTAFPRRMWLPATVALVLLCGMCVWLLSKHSQILPDHMYVLHDGRLDGAKAFGGVWEVVGGAVHNNSDESGAKLVTGSTRWRDYTLSADVKFDGDRSGIGVIARSRDMGIVVRSTNEEEGVDAYSGYYVGLRTTDGTLIIGRSDYGWMEARPVPMPGGVHAGTWYHLIVTAVGCRIAASSQNMTTRQTAWIAMEEYPCAEAGRIGLRSLATGGMWRNIHIQPAMLGDYMSLRSHITSVGYPEFPKREADYNRIYHFGPSYGTSARFSGVAAESSAPLHLIGDLQNLPRFQNGPISLRGVVTLATRNLYVQDSEGGVFVTGAQIPPLNVGDEVEVTGYVQSGLYSSTIRSSRVRLLWGGAPIPPLAITPLQAASGTYDARFVEIEGRLTGIRQIETNEQALEFVEDGQPFSALYVNQPFGSLSRLEINSRLRIRGVCVLDRKVTHEITPFAILLRSSDDIQIIAPPPWWTPWHLTMLFVVLIGLALLIQLIYFRIQTQQANALTQERERLAHDIHDTMAQSFAGIGYQIQGIRSIALRKDRPELRPIAEQLDVAYQLVRKSHEEASRTIAMLHASAPDTGDELVSSLANTAKKIAGDQIDTQTRIEGTHFRLNLRLSNALLHIGQEAITNAVSHGNPTQLTITLRYHGPRIELIVEDNGSGFDATPETVGFGILGMQKRAQGMGAQLQIVSARGKGTQIRISATSKPATFRSRMMAKTTERLHAFAKWLRAA